MSKEETKMKATSVQNIKNVRNISFSIENYPMEMESKLTIVASTDDDIFKFEFEGPDLLEICKGAGLFTGWEKDQKIRELEKELGEWKKAWADCLKLRDEVRKEKNKEINKLNQQLQQAENDKKRLTWKNEQLEQENEKLKKELSLEKAANEAKHKFFMEYAGKGTEIEFNYAIGDTGEVTYVIVDKEKYEYFKNSCSCVKINGECYTPEQMVSRIKELEALKTPTIENFADETPADNVNHPSHYTGKYECIDVMQDVFGNEATDNFCLCNAFKYIWRARKKNGLEDVKKAVWYLNKYIEEAEKDGVSKGEQV